MERLSLAGRIRREGLRTDAAAGEMRKRVVGRFPTQLVFGPDFLGRREARRFVERGGRDVDRRWPVDPSPCQRRAAAAAESPEHPGRGFEFDGSGSVMVKLLDRHDGPCERRRTTRKTAAATVASRQGRGMAGDAIANRAAKTTTLLPDGHRILRFLARTILHCRRCMPQ